MIRPAFALCVFLAGCCFSPFSATSHSNVTALKQAHAKYISELTDCEFCTWDSERFEAQTRLIEVGFSGAIQHAEDLPKAKCEKLRVRNLELLRDVFDIDAENIRRKNRLLTDVEAETLSLATTQAYDAALRAECNRLEAMPAESALSGYCQ